MKRSIKKIQNGGIYFKTYLIGVLSSFFLAPIFVFAQRKYEQSIFGIFEYAKDIIDDLVLWLFTTGAVIFFLWKIVKYIYALSQGDEKNLKNIKEYLFYGLIALTVMFTFYAISSLIAVTFGIQIGIPQFFQDQTGLGRSRSGNPSGTVQSRSFIQ